MALPVQAAKVRNSAVNFSFIRLFLSAGRVLLMSTAIEVDLGDKQYFLSFQDRLCLNPPLQYYMQLVSVRHDDTAP